MGQPPLGDGVWRACAGKARHCQSGAPSISSSAVMRAGTQLSTSSARAAHLPAQAQWRPPRAAGYPHMASAVLAKRYSAAPGRPSSTNQNSGATSESHRFSARVSMADSRTMPASSTVVSRLTKRASCCCPASSDWPNASSTATTSSCSMAQASMGLSSSAITSTAPTSGRRKAMACNSAAAVATKAAPAHHAKAPPTNWRMGEAALPLGAGKVLCAPTLPAAPTCGAMRAPMAPSKLPIHTTGCQRRPGSPSKRSTHRASAGTQASNSAQEEAIGYAAELAAAPSSAQLGSQSTRPMACAAASLASPPMASAAFSGHQPSLPRSCQATGGLFDSDSDWDWAMAQAAGLGAKAAGPSALGASGGLSGGQLSSKHSSASGLRCAQPSWASMGSA